MAIIMHTIKSHKHSLKHFQNKAEYEKWLLEESDNEPSEKDVRLMEWWLTLILGIVCLGVVLLIKLSQGA